MFYLFYYCFYIVENFFIRETENMKSHVVKGSFPDSIIFLLLTFSMIATVHFDYQALFTRHKINNIITNNMLPEKLHT